MTSELSIFAARLRDHIGICAEEFDRLETPADPALLQHADAEFNGLAILLFTLQFKHNLPYRKICEARGVVPASITRWSQIPAVPTSAFKELELTCLQSDQRTRVFHSSGTTEQRPSRHFHNTESLAVYEMSLWPWLAENLRFAIYDLRLLCLTPPPVQTPHSSLVYMFDFARQKFGADESIFVGRVGRDGSWTLDFDSAFELFVQNPRPQTSDSRPLLILGTAFSFVHLLDAMAEGNLRLKLPVGSCVLETGGYKGRSRTMPKEELHRLITERLDVPASNIICEYGMSELSSQAYDIVTCDKRQVTRGKTADSCHSSLVTCHFRFPPWARVQIISPETGREVADGETGLIRVFDLANVFSVMAIQTEDLAVRRGDGFELIGRAILAEPRGCSLTAA